MAKYEEFGTPGINSGILHPAMSHQFRVLLNDSKLIAVQVTRVDVDMVQRTFTVYIQQPIGLSQEMLDEIYKLCNLSRFPDTPESPAKFPFKIQLLDGCDGVHSEIVGYAHVVQHSYELDYAKNLPAEHKLVLRYTPAVVGQ